MFDRPNGATFLNHLRTIASVHRAPDDLSVPGEPSTDWTRKRWQKYFDRTAEKEGGQAFIKELAESPPERLDGEDGREYLLRKSARKNAQRWLQ